MKKINILISAHEFCPYLGSECAVGWNIIMNLANDKDLNLYVLYAEGSQASPFSYEKEIKKYKSKYNLPENLELIAVKQPMITILIFKINMFFFRKMGGLGFPVLYFLGYSFWQKNAFKSATEICKLRQIDIIHNLTQISFRESGYYHKLNIPLVWGPISGFSQLPYNILLELNWKLKIFEVIRNISNYYQLNLKKRTILTLKKARLIYLISKNEKNKIVNINRNIKILVETGLTIDFDSEIRNFKTGEKLNLIWLGRLENRKSLDIVFESLSKISNVNDLIELIIIGEGPLMNKYKNQTELLNLKCVKFVGKIAHADVNKYLKLSHLLVHTSYREGTPHVILEALSTGLPVLCHDIGGMSYVVDEKCGIKITLFDKKTSVINFRMAILKLLNEPELISKLSKGAILRRKNLTWDKIAQIICDDYKNIIFRNNLFL